MSAENVTYFDSFGVENIPKEIKKFTGNKELQQIFLEHKDTILEYKNTIRMCGYVCIGFHFMSKRKSLLDYKLDYKSNLFCLNEHEKNDRIILKYFK